MILIPIPDPVELIGIIDLTVEAEQITDVFPNASKIIAI